MQLKELLHSQVLEEGGRTWCRAGGHVSAQEARSAKQVEGWRERGALSEHLHWMECTSKGLRRFPLVCLDVTRSQWNECKKENLWQGPASSHAYWPPEPGYRQPVCRDAEAWGKHDVLKIYSAHLFCSQPWHGAWHRRGLVSGCMDG